MDMDALMEQARQLQDKVAAAQDLLDKTVVKGIAGAGDVIIDMSGKYDLIKMTINPDVVARGTDAITDAVMAAYRDAKAKADAAIDRVMGDATAGMPMPM